MYHVSAQGIDERMINVHYYYYVQQLKSNFFFMLSAPLPGPFHRQPVNVLGHITHVF